MLHLYYIYKLVKNILLHCVACLNRTSMDNYINKHMQYKVSNL